MNVISEGEVVEGVTGEVVEGVTGEVAGVLLVGDLTWRASSESETGSLQAELDSSDTEAPICVSQDLQPGPGRPCHRRQMPARICDGDSDQNDGVLCVLCNENSPIDLAFTSFQA